MNHDKRNIRAALKVWDRLGDIPISEDGERLDYKFSFRTVNGELYKYSIGDSLDDLWHDLEELFYPFSVGLAANNLYDKNYNELKEGFN